MKRGWLAVLLLLAVAAGPAAAADDEVERITFGGHVLDRLFALKVRDNSRRNPGNLARLGTISNVNELLLRVDARPADQVRARFSGRLWYTPTDDREPLSSFLDELFAEVRFTDNLLLRAGKARLSWGTALAWSPVELFQQAKDAQGLAQVYEGFPQLTLDFSVPRPTDSPFDALLLTLAIVPDLPAGQPAKLDRTRFALRLYGSFPEIDAALIAAAGGGRPLQLGATFSAALFGEVTIYGEGMFRRGSDRPELLPGPLPQLRSRANDSDVLPRIVVGARYTLPGDVVTAVEYFHNGEGYDANAWNNYLAGVGRFGELARAAQVASQATGGGLLPALAESRVAAGAAALPAADLRRNYLMISLNRGNIDEWLSLGARAIVGLDDGSFLVGPMITARPFDNVQFSLNALAWRGAAGSEFGEFPVSLLGLLETRVYF